MPRRPQTRANKRRVPQLSALDPTQIVPGRTKQSDLQHYTVYQVPEEELWRLSILESLMEIRSDNWSVIFNEEEEEEDDLGENDIEAMIYEACTT